MSARCGNVQEIVIKSLKLGVDLSISLKLERTKLGLVMFGLFVLMFVIILTPPLLHAFMGR